MLKKPPAGPGLRRREKRVGAGRGAEAAALSSCWRCERSCWPMTTCMSSCGRAGGAGQLRPRPHRPLPVGPVRPAPHLPGLQLLRQRHLLADGAKQLPGEGVPLQRNAAELQGQFQDPAGEGQRAGPRTLGLQRAGVMGGSWTQAGVRPLIRNEGSQRAPGRW